MIIGHGDIASVLTDRNDLIYFASGVSNSREMRNSEYLREYKLLMKQDSAAHLVYFSSLCVFYACSRYAEHKRFMETAVKDTFNRWTIMRLGNITWGTNPNTIINHFRALRRHGAPLDIQDTYRYIIDLGEFLHWIAMIPDWSCEMNITGRRMSIHQIVEELV